jgi:hypothetical protein
MLAKPPPGARREAGRKHNALGESNALLHPPSTKRPAPPPSRRPTCKKCRAVAKPLSALNHVLARTAFVTSRLADFAAFDLAIASGATRALRRHAASIRRRAASGVTVIDVPFAVVRSCESAQALKIAADLDRIASDLESGGVR